MSNTEKALLNALAVEKIGQPKLALLYAFWAYQGSDDLGGRHAANMAFGEILGRHPELIPFAKQEGYIK